MRAKRQKKTTTTKKQHDLVGNSWIIFADTVFRRIYLMFRNIYHCFDKYCNTSYCSNIQALRYFHAVSRA